MNPQQRSSNPMTPFDLQEAVSRLIQRRGRIVLAIDGDAASGKTTAADQLVKKYNGAVIHMDDFFLPPDLRTSSRLSEAGGNVHYERFIEEVLPGVRANRAFSYHRFDCSRMNYAGLREVSSTALTVIEGAYSLHPKFGTYYDFAVFCTVSPEEQSRRILLRNGPDLLKKFQTVWIPMEHRYQTVWNIPEKCDMIVSV